MRTERCDVCVIGSGAGGALFAHRAARAGKSVIVVERGPYVRSSEMTDSEFEMMPRLYKDGGLQTTTSMDLFILQGSCVGGSTVLSNMVMMRAAPEVFAEWNKLGARVDPSEMAACYARIEGEVHSGPVKLANVAQTTHRFLHGAGQLGISAHPMNKALGDCVGCGNCNIGCTFGTKRSALTTYIPWAEAEGARVLADTEVERIERSGSRVRGVIARGTRTGEPIRIEAKQTVVAAGAIGSSEVLHKSGFRRNVGTRVSFNAGSMMIGDFEDTLEGFDGDQMTWFVHGDDVLIEPTHNPLLLSALTTPGYFGQHGDLMKRQAHLAYAGALVATRPTGRVVHSPFWGHEETRFHAGEDELSRLRRGLRTIGEVFFAAGARRVILPTHEYCEVRSARELDVLSRALVSTARFSFATSHPQGGNPMSDDPDVGVVDNDFRAHGTDGLFVCDASVFPSGVRVNPVATIMALADYASSRILAQA